MLDPDEEQTKSVFAHFGAAVYYSQCLEHGIVNALVILSLIPEERVGFETQKDWAARVDEFMNGKFKKTLGMLLNEFRQIETVPPETEEILAESLCKRNWLAHGYFRDRATEFMDYEGRIGMINELESIRLLLQKANCHLEMLLKPIHERYGFTEKMFSIALDELLAESKVSRSK